MWKKFTKLYLGAFIFFVNIAYPYITPHYPVSFEYKLSHGEHLLVGKYPHDNRIELENGAQFEIIDRDAEKVMNWNINDIITFCPSIFGYKFELINQDLDQSAKGSFVVGPFIPNNPPRHFPIYTRTIATIDHANGIIYLKDEKEGIEPFCWEIYKDDIKQIRPRQLQSGEWINGWEVGDSVIIGKTNSWDALISGCSYILFSYENSYIKEVRSYLQKKKEFRPSFVRAMREQI